MNWYELKRKKPIDGQKVLVYTQDHEIFYVTYSETFYIKLVSLNGTNACCGCEPDSIHKDEITHWASPQPPEIES